MNNTLLKDALHNLSEENVGNDPLAATYARGVLVGVVVGLMATGMSFDTAYQHCLENFPRNVPTSVIPEAWNGKTINPIDK